jgi:DNA-binding Lrp family transcriptional regulator
MSIRAYVLIETEVGSIRAVSERLQVFEHRDGRLLAADTVTGPFDVIAVLEADDLDRLGNCITGGLQGISGVRRTTTCLAIRLG